MKLIYVPFNSCASAIKAKYFSIKYLNQETGRLFVIKFKLINFLSLFRVYICYEINWHCYKAVSENV